jgi:hypothetical protein
VIGAEQLTTVVGTEATGDPEAVTLELEAGDVALCSPQPTVASAATRAIATAGLISG